MRTLKRTLSFIWSKTVFTRVFIIGHKTLLTTMYLFFEEEIFAVVRSRKQHRVFVPASHKHICAYYLFWVQLHVQLFMGAQKRRHFNMFYFMLLQGLHF